MKATGVVRRIDDLGRIVIPIEIRRTMKIRDGDPLEIFVERNGEVILKKYSAIADLGEFALGIAESLYEASQKIVLVGDRDEIVAVAGVPEREYKEKNLGSVVLKAMDSRQIYRFQGDKHNHEGSLVGDYDTCQFTSEVIIPIVVAGDPVGVIIIASREGEETVGDLEEKLAETAAGFLARHMDE